MAVGLLTLWCGCGRQSCLYNAPQLGATASSTTRSCCERLRDTHLPPHMKPKKAAGPAMSWWSHLKHWLIMPKPPPVVCRARAFELLWLRHAHSGTLGPAWIYDYGPGAVHHPVRDRGWWRCKSSRVPGPSGSASTTSSRRAGRRPGAHSSLTACPLARPCARTDCRLRLSRSCRPSWGRCLGCCLGRRLGRCLGRCGAPSLLADKVPPPQLLLPLRATLTFTLTHP